MDQHIRHSGGAPLPVDDVIVKHLVTQEQRCNDQKRHRGKVHGAEADLTLKIRGDRNDHLSEGKDHIQHGPLRQMRKVDQSRLFPIREITGHPDSVQHCQKGKCRKSQRHGRQRQQYQRRLSQQHKDHVPDRFHRSRLAAVVAHLDHILKSDIHQDQRPCNIILCVKMLPVQACPLADVIQQIHIYEQEDVIAHAVPAEHIDVERGEIPDLDDRQRAQHIRQEHAKRNKSVLHCVQQRIVPPDHIHKDQIIDQLQILDLLLLRQKGRFFLTHFSFSSHSSVLNPVSTNPSPTTSGRFTSIPSVARSASCSSSLISGSFFESPISR